MLTNLFRCEVNIDQWIKETVNRNQLLKSWGSLMFRSVQVMPADKNW